MQGGFYPLTPNQQITNWWKPFGLYYNCWYCNSQWHNYSTIKILLILKCPSKHTLLANEVEISSWSLEQKKNSWAYMWFANCKSLFTTHSPRRMKTVIITVIFNPHFIPNHDLCWMPDVVTTNYDNFTITSLMEFHITFAEHFVKWVLLF